MTSCIVNVDVAGYDPDDDALWPTTGGQWSLLITPHSDQVVGYLSGTLDELDGFLDRCKTAVATRRNGPAT